MTPTRKVGAGALAGAATIILVYLIDLWGPEVPAAVASAITVILTFLVSYFVPDGDDTPPEGDAVDLE